MYHKTLKKLHTYLCKLHSYSRYISAKLTIMMGATLVTTVYLHGKTLVWEKIGKIWWIMSYSPKFSLPIFTDTPKTYLGYALTVAYLPNFSLPIALPV